MRIVEGKTFGATGLSALQATLYLPRRAASLKISKNMDRVSLPVCVF